MLCTMISADSMVSLVSALIFVRICTFRSVATGIGSPGIICSSALIASPSFLRSVCSSLHLRPFFFLFTKDDLAARRAVLSLSSSLVFQPPPIHLYSILHYVPLIYIARGCYSLIRILSRCVSVSRRALRVDPWRCGPTPSTLAVLVIVSVTQRDRDRRRAAPVSGWQRLRKNVPSGTLTCLLYSMNALYNAGIAIQSLPPLNTR